MRLLLRCDRKESDVYEGLIAFIIAAVNERTAGIKLLIYNISSWAR